MFKNYCAVLIMSLCLLSACKSDKGAKATPAKTETPAKKVTAKTPKKNAAEKKAANQKKASSTATTGKVRKGYWTGLQDSADFPEDKFAKLQSLEKERRAKLAAASDSSKPAINKDYSAKKKTLLGHKLFRAYREYDKKWKTRSK